MMAPQIGIRKMTALDAPAVFLIEKAVAISPWSEKLFADCVAVGYECWVITFDQEIIGFGVLSSGAGEAHILNLAIMPAKQRSGFGHKMLQALINRAQALGAVEVFLEVRESNLAAQELYKKFGFVDIGMRADYYPQGDNGEPSENAVTMALPLR